MPRGSSSFTGGITASRLNTNRINRGVEYRRHGKNMFFNFNNGTIVYSTSMITSVATMPKGMVDCAKYAKSHAGSYTPKKKLMNMIKYYSSHPTAKHSVFAEYWRGTRPYLWDRDPIRRTRRRVRFRN